MLICFENSEKIQHGHRGNRNEIIVKKLAVFFYIRGGKGFYEFFNWNLKFPAVSSLKNFMLKELKIVNENVFRFNELKNYLIENNFPLEVHVFEDGTKVVEKIEFCSETNSLIGLDAPFDSSTGLPFMNYHSAKSAKSIHHSITSFDKASYAQIILAQPNVAGK